MAERSVSYVYILFHHVYGTPLYVGKGKGERWNDHEWMNDKHHNNNYLRSVIRAAKKLKIRLPKIKVREGLTDAEAIETEIALIAAIGRKDLGSGPLANLTAGGDGFAGYIYGPIPIEVRAKISAALSGRELSEEHKASISERMLNGGAIAMLKALQTTLQAQGRSGPRSGQRVTTETKAKMSASHAGVKKSLEHVRNATHPQSAETRRKISETRLRKISEGTLNRVKGHGRGYVSIKPSKEE